MKCKKCKSENLSFHVKLFVSFNVKHLHKITKKAFKEKDTQLWSADWDKCKIICSDCGQVTDL